jgi:N-acetylglucosaminyl-diphospho-decaprenol L-rhamnosyltransferase
MPDVSIHLSIIIVSYNVEAIMRDCLHSIERETAQESLSYEIIIVDNASTDNSCVMVEQEFPSVRLIKSALNQGFAKANNIGLAVARGRFVLFLNPDTVILNRALERLCTLIDSRPDVGVVGPHTYDADGRTTQATALHDPTLLRAFHLHVPLWRLVPGWQPTLLGEFTPTHTGAVDIVKGSCMLMRTAMAREIGGMNEQYFMYSEEVDLCEAVRGRGFVVWYTLEASIIHLGGASTGAVSEEMAVHLLRSSKTFFGRRYAQSPIALSVLRLLLIVGSSWRFAAWSGVILLGRNHHEAHTKRRAHGAMLRWLWFDFS